MSKLTTMSAAFLLAAFACSDSGSAPSTATPTPSAAPASPSAQVVTVEVRDFEFSPKSIVIQPGQTVRWILRGNDHTHTTVDRDGAWDSGMAFGEDGAIFERTFTAEEGGMTYNYSCASHKACCTMQGSIRVGASAPPPDEDY